MVRRRAVDAHPAGVAEARAGRADVGVRVVAVDAPALEHLLHVAVFAGAADVVHDLVMSIFEQGCPNASGDIVQDILPGRTDPLSFAALTGALHWIEDAVGIVDLVDRGRALGAIATARAGMERIALQLADAQRLLVDVGQQPAGGLAVEADRRDDRVAPLDPLRPGLRVQLGPVIPLVSRWVGSQPAGDAGIPGLVRRHRGFGLPDGPAERGRIGSFVLLDHHYTLAVR